MIDISCVQFVRNIRNPYEDKMTSGVHSFWMAAQTEKVHRCISSIILSAGFQRKIKYWLKSICEIRFKNTNIIKCVKNIITTINSYTYNGNKFSHHQAVFRTVTGKHVHFSSKFLLALGPYGYLNIFENLDKNEFGPVADSGRVMGVLTPSNIKISSFMF